ncbi:PDZ domain-containing protein [Flavobacteriaceae bacterium TP-CH-4]|uniref:PDZ domain-containing protein n=1 Tax=Pelagihabitans pacificus TaxID=2696054 RepID=A0A967ATW9_9FLAO|nr:trypsin-like peptidase domain-containing protein [Pelagihabitans pacificus]NHF59330.1 PDZ domain-containing protein [Pelagihabitans pacificus]
MKKISSLLLVSIFAGAITLGAYKLFIEKPNYALVTEANQPTTFNTSYTPTSAKGAGINEVDFTIAAEKTVNAVVHVKNVAVSSGPTSLMDFFYGSGGSQRAQVGTGSGVIITPDGYIVTNNHVVAKASQLQITLNNNKTYEAELVGADPTTDVALLKIDAEESLPYLAFGDSDNTKIGEWVLAVGNPFNLTSTVTAGIVSAKARNLGRNQSFIQTDAAVNPGNSGGALVNTNGDLVGINTAISSQTGSYVGYSFAIPSNIAKKIVEDIMEYGNVRKGVLGISSVQPNSSYALENGLSEVDGVYVNKIEEDSGADDADLKEGDVIKMVDNIRVRKFPDLTGYISSKRPGDKIQVKVDRGGEEIIAYVTLKEVQTIQLPMIGLTVKDVSKEDQKKFKIKEGVKITDVPERLKGYGLEGKILIGLDDEKIEDKEDAKNLFSQISRYGTTSLTILNEDGERERIIFQ